MLGNWERIEKSKRHGHVKRHFFDSIFHSLTPVCELRKMYLVCKRRAVASCVTTSIRIRNSSNFRPFFFFFLFHLCQTPLYSIGDALALSHLFCLHFALSDTSRLKRWFLLKPPYCIQIGPRAKQQQRPSRGNRSSLPLIRVSSLIIAPIVPTIPISNFNLYLHPSKVANFSSSYCALTLVIRFLFAPHRNCNSSSAIYKFEAIFFLGG